MYLLRRNMFGVPLYRVQGKSGSGDYRMFGVCRISWKLANMIDGRFLHNFDY
jgi:hypothetical protein